MPYLDSDLFDFLTALPDWMLLKRTLHDETIVRAYPNFASVPYSEKGPPPKLPLHERLRIRIDREIGECRMFGIGKRPLPRLRRFHHGLMPWIAEVLNASEGAEVSSALCAKTSPSLKTQRKTA
jgi:hypothetical protein